MSGASMPPDAPGNRLLANPPVNPDSQLLGMTQYQQSPAAFAQNQLFQGMMQARDGAGDYAPPPGNQLLQQMSAPGGASGSAPGPGQPVAAASPVAQAQQALARLNLTPQQVSDELQNSENIFHLLAPLARQEGGVTSSELMSRAGDAVAAGMFTAPQAASFLARIPDTNAPSGGTDRFKAAQLKSFVQQHLAGAVMANMHLQGIAKALGPALPPPTGQEPPT